MFALLKEPHKVLVLCAANVKSKPVLLFKSNLFFCLLGFVFVEFSFELVSLDFSYIAELRLKLGLLLRNAVAFAVWQPIAVHQWPPMIYRNPVNCGPPMATESFTGGHRCKMMNTPLDTDGSTGDK